MYVYKDHFHDHCILSNDDDDGGPKKSKKLRFQKSFICIKVPIMFHIDKICEMLCLERPRASSSQSENTASAKEKNTS